jgi:hypothetical protein
VQTALEGRSRAEVAMSLGVTEGAVRQLVHRGRTRLRQAAAGVVPLPLLRWLTGAAGRADEAAGGVAVATGTVAAGAKIAAAVLTVGALTVGAGAEIRHLRDAPAGRTAERASGPADEPSGARPSAGAAPSTPVADRGGSAAVSRSEADRAAATPGARPRPVTAEASTPVLDQAPGAPAAPRPEHAAGGVAHPPGAEATEDDAQGATDAAQSDDEGSAAESTGGDAASSYATDAPTVPPDALADLDAEQQPPPTEE